MNVIKEKTRKILSVTTKAHYLSATSHICLYTSLHMDFEFRTALKNNRPKQWDI